MSNSFAPIWSNLTRQYTVHMNNGLVAGLGLVSAEADYSFKLSEPLMHNTPLFVFKGRPADEDQEAVIEFADQHGMAVILDGRAVTLITDQSKIATLFKLTFGGDA
ncbi:hypothetical protein [Sphingobium yanoikuyae]|uniref:hypothetical protein n=1 Tax=Sphingobium yanoikuyae TaxID=13690 RepID=UPI000A97DB75|nr:hypothetical protein [Sphingobium yanoikuyae]